MKKSTLQHYEAPKAEVIEIESLGVLCASGGATPASAGGGTQGMGMTNINWP